MATVPYDLQARARRAVLEAGFQPDFLPEVIEEIQRLAQKAPHDAGPGVRDMRAVLWSSIDNDTSRDLDQVEYVEPLPDGGTRLLVGVAEVDSCAPKGSATDRQAGRQATSVYTGPATFPMLPGELSTDKTSLVEDQDRLSIVIEMRLRDPGEPPAPEVYRAWIRNHAKLAYNSTAAWLEGRGPMPPAIARVPGMEGQLRLQQKTSEKLRACRKQQGALAFDSMEPVPTLIDGRVQGLTARQQNVAEDIIENFMVAANVAIAQYPKNHNTLSLRRVVRTPRRWDRIQAIASRFAVELPSAPESSGGSPSSWTSAERRFPRISRTFPSSSSNCLARANTSSSLRAGKRKAISDWRPPIYAFHGTQPALCQPCHAAIAQRRPRGD